METSAEPEKAKAFRLRGENEGFSAKTAGKQDGGLASSFSLTEKPAMPARCYWSCNGFRCHDRDEHSLTGILTPGSTSLPPSRPLPRPVAYWEFVTRHSGATVPESHGVPCHLAVLILADAQRIRCFQRASVW